MPERTRSVNRNARSQRSAVGTQSAMTRTRNIHASILQKDGVARMSHLAMKQVDTHLRFHAVPDVPKLDWSVRLLSALPALCFVHCVASTVLMLALPAAASLWSQGEWLEAPLWLLSMAAVATMLTRRGLWRSLAGALFVLALGVGLFGLSQEIEAAHRASLLLLVGTQVVLWRHKRQQAAATVCNCEVHRAAV